MRNEAVSVRREAKLCTSTANHNKTARATCRSNGSRWPLPVHAQIGQISISLGTPFPFSFLTVQWFQLAEIQGEGERKIGSYWKSWLMVLFLDINKWIVLLLDVIWGWLVYGMCSGWNISFFSLYDPHSGEKAIDLNHGIFFFEIGMGIVN